MNSDYLIIGGGIIGLATAFRLAKTGAQVTVVERGTVGAEASWAGAGILSPLLPWHYLPAVTDLCLSSAEMYPDWVAEIQAFSSVDTEYWRCGMLVLPPFDSKLAAEWCEHQHWPVQTIPAPSSCTAGTEALWLAQVAQIRNPRLIKSLRAAALALGVKFLEHTEVTALEIRGQRMESIHTGNSKLTASTFISCAGAWTQGLLTNYPPAKSIKPIRGQMLLFKADKDTLQHIIYEQGIYLIPRRDGHILVGSTLEDVGFDKNTTPAAQQHLMEVAFRLLPALRKAPLLRHWSGLRPGSPDNIPTIARHPDIDNLFVNAGHFRYGVTMAPASANLIADLILQQPPQMDMHPYRWTG